MGDTINPDALKKARKKLGLTQDQLAQKSGCSKEQISRWERGKSLEIRASSRDRLTRALSVGWDELARPPTKTGEETPDTNAFDGNPGSIWHTEWGQTDPPHPHEIQIDMGKEYDVRGFAYLPRQSGENGRIADYEFYLSADGSNWGSPSYSTSKEASSRLTSA